MLPPEEQSLESRVARLERALPHPSSLLPLRFGLALFFTGTAVALAVLGLGYPNHFYQAVLAFVLLALAYQRGWLLPLKTTQYFLAPLNAFLLTTLFKLVIGSGRVFPFSWLRYPTVSPSADAKWLSVLPSMALNWQDNALSLWSMDLTVLQTFLLFTTILGGMIRFQPFASLTALFLLIVSLPALSSFRWDFVFPALVCSSVALYMQSAWGQGPSCPSDGG